MPKTSKQTRFNQLHLALQYCTDTGGYFSAGERICINQERAKLLNYEHESDYVTQQATDYPHNDGLAVKIHFIIEKVTNTAYQPRPRLLSRYAV